MPFGLAGDGRVSGDFGFVTGAGLLALAAGGGLVGPFGGEPFPSACAGTGEAGVGEEAGGEDAWTQGVGDAGSERAGDDGVCAGVAWAETWVEGRKANPTTIRPKTN